MEHFVGKGNNVMVSNGVKAMHASTFEIFVQMHHMWDSTRDVSRDYGWFQTWDKQICGKMKYKKFHKLSGGSTYLLHTNENEIL